MGDTVIGQAVGTRSVANAERRSIEFVPHDERYGAPWRLFTLWFSSNMQISALVVGFLGILAGLSLAWALIAIVIGVSVGSIFMAAHSAQGPQLGIPQMIQSRAQFGVFGAGIPLLIYVLANILFSSANAILMRSAIQSLVGVGDAGAIVLFGVVTLFVSYYGYELIHRLGVYLTIASTVVFGITFLLVIQRPYLVAEPALSLSSLQLPLFMFMVTQAASWTIGFGPYVADYSRYLPADASARATFWYSYAGNVLGAGIIMLIGAVLASHLTRDVSDISAHIGALFGALQPVATIIIVLGILQINVLNVYSGFMSGVTVFTGFSGTTSLSRSVRFCVMALIAASATIIAILVQKNFDSFFSDVLVAQVYLIVPWSAINLVDYYYVARGKYHVPDIYDARGRYGGVNWRTMSIYFVSVIAQLPFMRLTFFEGSVARALHADIAWIPALIVPAALYMLFARKVDHSEPDATPSDRSHAADTKTPITAVVQINRRTE